MNMTDGPSNIGCLALLNTRYDSKSNRRITVYSAPRRATVIVIGEGDGRFERQGSFPIFAYGYYVVDRNFEVWILPDDSDFDDLRFSGRLPKRKMRRVIADHKILEMRRFAAEGRPEYALLL